MSHGVIDLGTIIAGKPSKLKINAVSPTGTNLFIRLKRGIDAGELPQGLKIAQDGAIVGRTTFRNVTTFDKGTTTFSVTHTKGEVITTFDNSYIFKAEAYDSIGPISSISVIDGGSGYTSAPDVTITGGGGVRATATCTLTGDSVSSVTVTNGGEGFTYEPNITFTGGGGSGALASATILGGFGVHDTHEYKITVTALKAKPWQDLYCVALPKFEDRLAWRDFTSNFNIFDQDALYRKNDERFGLQRDIRILIKSGLNPKYLDDYMHELEAYHYTKTLRFGELKSARSYVNNMVEYEVIYFEIQEVNSSEEAIIDLSITDFDFAPVYADSGKVRASLGDNPGIADYSADMSTWLPAYDVFPNSFYNMRNKLTTRVGEVVSEAKSLPSWMSTQQADGSILQYKTVVPIAYVKPGEAERIKFLIRKSNFNPNTFLFQVDRYEWDKDLSLSYDIDNDRYATRVYTTYDGTTTTFDEEDMRYMDVVQTITGTGSLKTFNLNYYTDRSGDLAIFGDIANAGKTGKLDSISDYEAQLKSITFNFIPLNNDKYYIVFREYAPQTYHKVGEKDKYMKFPQTGVYE